ncbi:MAG: four helix bundle protein [Planctomycetota bacterium]|nr:four helix bundle protein [Planctomycetota bacterium]
MPLDFSAAGWGRRGSKGDFARFMIITMGRTQEMETHVILATSLDMKDQATKSELLDACDRIGRQLLSLLLWRVEGSAS